MPRHKKPDVPATEVAVHEAVIAAGSAAMNELSAAQRAVIASAELFKAVGRIENAHKHEMISGFMMAQAYLVAKEELSKIKELAVIDQNGNPKCISSLEEFCAACLPVSARRCQQIVRDMELLGDRAFEQAGKLGLTGPNYKAIRELPAEHLDLVKQAIETGNKDSVLGLIAQLTEGVRRAEKQADEAREESAAKDDLIAHKNQTIDRLQTKKKWKPSADSIARTEAEQAALEELGAASRQIELAVARFNVCAIELLSDAPPAIRSRAENVLQYLLSRAGEVINHHGLDVDIIRAGVTRPDWLNGVADDAGQG